MPSYLSNLSNQSNPQKSALNKKMGGFSKLFPGAGEYFGGKFGTNQNYAGTGGLNYAKPQSTATTTQQPITTQKSTSQPLFSGGGSMSPQPTTGLMQPKAPPIASSTSETIDPASAARSLYRSGEQTDWEKAAAQNLARAEGLKNVGQFAPYAEAKFYGVGGQSGGNLPDLALPDLAGRGGQTQELYNKFANLYGTQANIGLQAAQEAARRGQTAAQGVLTASLPGQLGLQSTLYSPLSGAEGVAPLGNRALTAANIGSVQELQGKRNAAATNLTSIQNIESLMKEVLGTTAVNPSDINAINQFINRLASNVSSPQYQAFNQYLASLKSLYADYLSRGGTLTNMSREEANSLLNGTASAETLLKGLTNLKNEANAYLAGYDNQIGQIVGQLNTGGTSQSTVGSQNYSDFNW